MTNYRIRMKFDDPNNPVQKKDYAKQIWQQGNICIRYWEWEIQNRTFEEVVAAPDFREAFHGNIQDVNVIHRFCNLTDIDWVFTVFDNEIHLAKVTVTPWQDFALPEENLDYLKARSIDIDNEKVFSLTEIPDVFALLAQSGQGTLFQIQNCRELLDILCRDEIQNANDLWIYWQGLNQETLLDFAGPSAWESLALAYLISEYQFLPVGLSVGGTLKDFDLVGISGKDKKRIYAQCKKDRTPKNIDKHFLQAISHGQTNRHAFYFAYGGLTEEGLRLANEHNIEVITRTDFLQWLTDEEAGRVYLDLFQNSPLG